MYGIFILNVIANNCSNTTRCPNSCHKTTKSPVCSCPTSEVLSSSPTSVCSGTQANILSTFDGVGVNPDDIDIPLSPGGTAADFKMTNDTVTGAPLPTLICPSSVGKCNGGNSHLRVRALHL